MLKTSLLFCAVAFLALFLGDLEISTSSPWQEFQKMMLGGITPDLKVLWDFKDSLLNTVTFAFCGTALGVLLGAIFSLFYQFTPFRLFFAFLRSIHELFWAFIFIPLVGLTPICGILAIAIPYSGVFAKVYAEIFQEADRRPLESLPANASFLDKIFYGILPVIYQDLKQYTAYRFECALRSSAVLGFIGLPTLGFHLESAFAEGHYSQAAAILFFFYLLVFALRFLLIPKWIPVYVLISFFLLSKEIYLSLENTLRFFTYEILPWPMRREGFYDGTSSVNFPVEKMFHWFQAILEEEIVPGIWNTVLLTQVALVCSGLVAMISFPWICRHLTGKISQGITHVFLIIGRTTPEYVLAYIFLQLWGPSMLPAIVAIAIHNGCILAFLTGRNANLLKMEVDAPQNKFNRHFFIILPRIYGQFLAFLFYRWEIILRESSILGIIGIYTIGFYVDSGLEEDRIDKAVLLILVTAFLTMFIDFLSNRIRKKMKISTKLSIEV